MKVARTKRKPLILGVSLVLALGVQFGLLELLRHSTEGGGLYISPPKRPRVRMRLDPTKPRVQPVEKPVELDGQVISVPEPRRQKRPKETRHLAQYDNDVPRERKARHRSRRARAPREAGERVRKRSRVQSPESRSRAPTKLDRTPRRVTPPRARADARPTERGDRAVSRERTEGDRPSLLRPTTDERSTLHNIQMLSSEFAADDPVLDVEEEGDTPLLRSRSFRYWDFFQRVKERVRQHWRPAEVYRQRDPSGRAYGVKDRLTMLRVTLDESGRVLRIATKKKSGLDFLDKEARRAFRASGPFPNPPKGMMDEFGHITFGVGFLFEINTKRHRFFWKRM